MKRGQAFCLCVRDGQREGEGGRNGTSERERMRKVDCLEAINLVVCMLRQSVECEREEMRDSRRD